MDRRLIVANNIQYYIAKNKITRYELCDAIDLNYSTLASWLKGRRYPRIEALEKIADYFNIGLPDLTENHTQISPEPKQSEFNTVLQFVLTKHPEIGNYKFTEKQLDSIVMYAKLLKEA